MPGARNLPFARIFRSPTIYRRRSTTLIDAFLRRLNLLFVLSYRVTMRPSRIELLGKTKLMRQLLQCVKNILPELLQCVGFPFRGHDGTQEGLSCVAQLVVKAPD